MRGRETFGWQISAKDSVAIKHLRSCTAEFTVRSHLGCEASTKGGLCRLREPWPGAAGTVRRVRRSRTKETVMLDDIGYSLGREWRIKAL